MPVYEYRCKDCRKKFSLVRTVKEYRSAARCPKCGKGKAVERIWSQVYAVTSRKS